MQVWIGFQRDDAYVHEWTGEVAEESDMGKAIGNASHHRLHEEQRQADLGNHDPGRQGLTGTNKGALAGCVVAPALFQGAGKVWP